MIPIRELRPTGAELREMVRLAWPVVLAQVGIMLLGVVDTAMVGRVGPEAVAAVALSHIHWVNLTLPGIGLLMVLDPVVAQAVGAGDRVAAARGVQRGVILAFALSVPTILLLMPGEWIYGALRQDPAVGAVAGSFSRWTALSVVPFYLFVAARQSLQAMASTRAVVIAIIAGNVINAALNWILIYGNLGAPALGVQGSAISTVIGRWLMLGILWWFGRDKLAPTLRPWHRESVRLQPLVRMAAIGAPVAFQQWLEVAVFAAGAVAIGWISVTALAAHEIAINLAALTFMVPLGLSAAAAAMVGRAVGRGDLAAARRDAVAAIGVGVLFMAAAGALFLFSPEPLAALFVSDPAAREITVSLIMIAGVFQVFDGIQCVSAGVLRGAADTRVPMLLHLGGFWGIGAPLSLWLAFGAGLGPQGIWWGYVGSLGAVAVAQLLRVRWRLSRDVARLRIEDTHEHAAP